MRQRPRRRGAGGGATSAQPKYTPGGTSRRESANKDSGRFAVGTPSFFPPRPYPVATSPRMNSTVSSARCGVRSCGARARQAGSAGRLGLGRAPKGADQRGNVELLLFFNAKDAERLELDELGERGLARELV